MKQGATSLLQRAWQSRGVLASVLLPIALPYALLLMLRRQLYRMGVFKSRRLNCAVIVVGNVVVGGAGKTPTTMGIVRHLQARGLQVGVVSRGYAGSAQSVCEVKPDSDASICGDEPILLARATRVPVFVAASRHAAGEALLRAHPRTQVIVCDDGLQHYRLWRDMEICVFDDRGCGNGWLLPSGPLRETWPRKLVARVGQRAERQLVLHTADPAAFAGFRARRTLADQALACDGRFMDLRMLRPPVLALAGIARPETFFASLRAAGVIPDQTLALPDHFDFSRLDTTLLRDHEVLCTEKDAVKLWKFWPQALAIPLVQTLEPAFLQALDGMLDAVLAAKLSSAHGHQTA